MTQLNPFIIWLWYQHHHSRNIKIKYEGWDTTRSQETTWALNKTRPSLKTTTVVKWDFQDSPRQDGWAKDQFVNLCHPTYTGAVRPRGKYGPSKNHFMSDLANTKKKFLIHLWDILVPRTVKTLNHLQNSIINKNFWKKPNPMDISTTKPPPWKIWALS